MTATRLARLLAGVEIAVEALVTYVGVRARLRRRGAAAVAGGIRPRPARRRVDVARVERLAGRVLGRFPRDGRCLVRSLVVATMLARRGVYARVVIGVRPAPDFSAHAWVEVAADAEPRDRIGGYARIAEL